MILSDKTIKEYVFNRKIGIEPFILENLQPSSLDLCLGKEFLIIDPTKCCVIDPKDRRTLIYKKIVIDEDEPFILQPGLFVLGTTIEKISLPNNIVARVEGRSSLGRMGILIHATAGYVDPGFEGNITLEISNVNHVPVKLYAGMRVCQVSFEMMDSNCEVPYYMKGKYKRQVGVTGTKIYEDFAKK